MTVQANLKYSNAPLIIENVNWLSISKTDNTVYINDSEYEKGTTCTISLDDILALSVYDLQKGGEIY